MISDDEPATEFDVLLATRAYGIKYDGTGVVVKWMHNANADVPRILAAALGDEVAKLAERRPDPLLLRRAANAIGRAITENPFQRTIRMKTEEPPPAQAHFARDHAQWSASATARNWTCAGAIAMGTLAGDEVESIHAATGTAGHEISEACLRDGKKDAADFIGKTVKTKQHEIEVDQELADSAQVYIDYVRSRECAQLLLEQRFSLSPLEPPYEAGGTCDAITINTKARLIEIIDFKNGMGVVEVNENKQTRTYALAALLNLDQKIVAAIDTIKVTIVQPRARHESGRIRSEDFPLSDLLEWATDLVDRMRVSRAAYDAFKQINGNRVVFDEWAEANLTTGNCTFCPAEGYCPKLRKEALSITPVDANKWFEDPSLETLPDISNHPGLQSPEQIEHILNGLDMLEAWIKAVRSHALTLANRGTKFEGWYLADKIGNRAYLDKGDDAKIAAALEKELKLKKEDIYEEPKVRSIAQIEKVLGSKRKAEMAALEGVLWHKPKTGVNLVQADKTERPPVPSIPEKFFEDPK